MNYELLVDDDGLLGDFKTELGDGFVLGETFKAMRRETRALKSLNDSVEHEPLKSALADACGKAAAEDNSETMQRALDDKLVVARKEKAAFVKKQQARAENGETAAAKQQTVDMMQAALQTAKDDLDPGTYWDLLCEATQDAEGDAEGKVEAKQEGDVVEGGP
jgi:hypothetical protein